MTNGSNRSHSLKQWQLVSGWLLAVCAIPVAFYILGTGNRFVLPQNAFLQLHSLLEIASAFIALLIFVICYRAIAVRRTGAVIFVGIIYLGVGLLDILHLLSYEGMPGLVTENNPNKAITFWLPARILAAVGLLIYVSLPDTTVPSKQQKRSAVAIILLMVLVVALTAFAYPQLLPPFYIEGYGLTNIKIVLECTVIAVYVLTLAVIIKRAQYLYDESIDAITISVVLAIISELLFTSYYGVTDLSNGLGHVYKIFSYAYLFQATAIHAFDRPLQLLLEDESREKAIIDSAATGVVLVDQGGIIIRVNPAFEILTGYESDELMGQSINLLLPEHQHHRHDNNVGKFFEQPSTNPMNAITDLVLVRKDGGELPVDISLGIWSEKDETRAVAFITDNSEKQAYERKLRHQATHDELTGLPNRWLFTDRLDFILEQAARNQSMIAVMILDLDNFKLINDTYGHTAGDNYLKQVASLFSGVLRAEDTIARLGGDEFAVCLSNIENPSAAATVANKLISSIRESIGGIGQGIISSVSIGISLHPDDADTSSELLRLADLAMYQAKNAGRGDFAFYSIKLDETVHENAAILPRLKKAIVNDEFELHYQPQIRIRDDEVVCFEALLRWHDSEFGDIPPSRFIPLAEASGLILQIDNWVLNAACKQIREWMDMGLNTRVAINFSAHQFRKTDIVEHINKAINYYQIDPSLLEIEIAEAAVMHDPEMAATQLTQLSEIGVSLTLDNFGTGYLSLSNLSRMPFSRLKIDGRYIRSIHTNSHDAVIVQSIIALGHALKIELVAEHAENAEQLQALQSYQCESCQGWYYARAMPAAECLDIARARRITRIT